LCPTALSDGVCEILDRLAGGGHCPLDAGPTQVRGTAGGPGYHLEMMTVLLLLPAVRIARCAIKNRRRNVMLRRLK